MGIDFQPERWASIQSDYDAWWQGKLDRPIVPVLMEGREPGRPEPKAPLLTQATCADLSIPAEAFIDRIDYELSCVSYLGDAFPFFNMDCFGPGVVAAFLGAKLDNSTGRVWFHPQETPDIRDLHFEYDPGNLWLERIKEVYRAGMERWHGNVLMGMVDLGGALDILSAFRPSEQLLLDLYDFPDEVLRLVWEIHRLWHRFYEELNEVLQPVNPGWSDWSGLYSSTPSYIVQSDFSYMISPAMFKQFTLPELEATLNRLDRSIYHLDGVGQLAHLDSLLSIGRLNAVQWVPGTGQPDELAWPEVYAKIGKADKKTQVGVGLNNIEKISGMLGSPAGIAHRTIRVDGSQESNIRRQLYRLFTIE